VEQAKQAANKKSVTGRVVSTKMTKTIVLEAAVRTLHPLYKKYITRTKRLKAHDETSAAGLGDLVRVVESRPLSRDKHWRLAEILERAK
jgi:small subunit ribosomal protein S17